MLARADRLWLALGWLLVPVCWGCAMAGGYYLWGVVIELLKLLPVAKREMFSDGVLYLTLAYMARSLALVLASWRTRS